MTQKLFIILSVLLVLMPSLAQRAETTCPTNHDGYLTPRMVVGERGRVLADVVLNVRPQPSLDVARLDVLRGGATFTVTDGARCADGFIWWQVDVDFGAIGWVAEGNLDDGEYYIEPRGELVTVADDDGFTTNYIRTEDGLLEPEGCQRPPDDYTRVQLGYATLNQRTVFMLDNAQRIYDANGGELVNFRQLITQGSYNAGGVAASFGTHDGGGAVDISVRSPIDWSVMTDEIPAMIQALRIAGFAAWVRDTGELYAESPIHIHAIAIGDAEASDIAQMQVNSTFGYFSGYNGLPPDNYSLDGTSPLPDRYGDPILCQWMVDMGFEINLADDEADEEQE